MIIDFIKEFSDIDEHKTEWSTKEIKKLIKEFSNDISSL